MEERLAELEAKAARCVEYDKATLVMATAWKEWNRNGNMFPDEDLLEALGSLVDIAGLSIDDGE